MLWTSGYYTVEATLIYNGEGYKPGNWSELDGETVVYAQDTGLMPEIEELRRTPETSGVAEDVPHEGRAIAEGARERMDGEC